MKTSSREITNVIKRDKIFPLSRRARQILITVILIAGDVIAIGLSFWLAYQLRFVLLPYTAPYDEEAYRQLVMGMIPFWVIIFAAFQLYSPHILFGGMQEYTRSFNAITTASVAMTIISFLRRDNEMFSRGWLLISWTISLVLVVVWRFIMRRVIYAFRQRGHFLSPALIIGANAEGRALAEQFANQPASGLYIAGFVDSTVPIGSNVSNGYKVIGNLADIEQLVSAENIEEVIIAPTALSREELLNTFRALNPNPEVNLRLSSGLFEILNTGLRVKELAFVPLIEVTKGRVSGFDAFLKFLVDYIGTLIIMLLLWPFLLLIALFIRLDSPGPVIYRRRVMGANGIEFDAFKFRTMYSNGEDILAAYPDLKFEYQEQFKIREDPRVTRVGNFLRKFSLDELPQFINVFLGQMSLVGPRMISPPEMAKYGKWGINLLTVKPGITGLWQISGRSDVSYEERIKLDMYYIRNWSLWLDIYILIFTIPAVLKQKGAY